MRARTRESVLPLQSSSSLILASISREGDSPLVVALFFILFAPHSAVFLSCEGTHHQSSAPAWPHVAWSGSRPEKAGQRGGLLYPVRHLRLVELVAFVDADVARVLALAGAGRDRSQRGAAEEGHLDVVREGVEPQEPTLALDAVQRRVPLHGLAHLGHVPHDERVEALPEVAFPARHGRDVGLHGVVAVALRDLRVAAWEEGRVRNDPLGAGLLCDLRRLFGRLVGHCVHPQMPTLCNPVNRTLALNCAGRLQSIRAKTCSRFAKNFCHPYLAPW